MATTYSRQYFSILVFLLSSLFNVLASAQDGSQDQLMHRAALGAIDMRQDTTCPGGGVCNFGNVCCSTGCMFSSGNCCGGGYFCYVGETCQGPSNVGDVQCCISGSCTPAKFVIYYASGGSGSASGSPAPYSTVASPTSQSPASKISTSAISGGTQTSQSLGTSPGTAVSLGPTSQGSPTAADTNAAGSAATTSAPAATTSKSGAAPVTYGFFSSGFLFSMVTLILLSLLSPF